MKKTFLKQAVYTAVFLFLTVCILTRSKLSLYYALSGLELWYHNMIPALLPFMILSGVMIRMELTEGFTTLVYPVIRPLFRVSRNVCYVMILGFLCGFPMGAKCVGDLYARRKLTYREAEFLLAFCNNIGPVYFCSFVLPLLRREKILPYVFGMYGLPFLYGLFLRHSFYRDITPVSALPHKERHDFGGADDPKLSRQLDDAIASSLESITMLGGYMILFNLLNLLPHLLFGEAPRLIAPLLEITGGLKMLGQDLPLYSLLVLPFGGLSCVAQTYSCIKDTGLSVSRYVLHKAILTCLTGAYYGCWYLLFPASFLC